MKDVRQIPQASDQGSGRAAPVDQVGGRSAPVDQAAGRFASVDADRGLDFAEVGRTVRKHWPTAFITLVAVTLTAVFYTLGQTKLYESSATVLFDPNPPKPLGAKFEQVVEMGTSQFVDAREYYETQYQLMQSMRIYLSVVNELGLDHDPSFLANLPAGVKPVNPSATVPPDVAAEILRGRVRVDPVKNSRLAKMIILDADPQRAARLIGLVVDTYVSLNLDDALQSTTNAADWLHAQLGKLKTDLESNEMALHDYKLDKNMLSVAFDDQSNMLRTEMLQIDAALTSVRTKREEVMARAAELRKISGTDPSILPATELMQSGLLSSLRGEYTRAMATRSSIMAQGKGEKHPDVLAATAVVDTTKAALLAEVKNIQGGLDRDVAIVSRQEGGLRSLFEKAKEQALDLNLLEIEYNRLKRSKEQTEKLYQLVIERSKESDLTRMLRVNNIRVVDRPRVARAPAKPSMPTNVGVGVVLGILLGLGAALARGLLDRTLKTPDDIEETLGMTFLGLVPEFTSKNTVSVGKHRRREKATQSELVIHEHPTSHVAEATRSIRTNILFMAPDDPLRTLLVTSAGVGEGKTTVACCIAIVMAQSGKRVLLIDCDLRRPRVHRIFKRSSNVGLTTALLQGDANVILETEVPNLSLICAGPIPPNPAEILQSERFKEYLAQLTQEFDHVILDSSPLMAVTDAAILSTLVDRTLVVVRAFKTRKDVGQRAVRSLVDVGARIAGVVLNAVDFNRGEYKYAYSYYRRYSNYGADSKEPRMEHTPGAQPPAPPPPV